MGVWGPTTVSFDNPPKGFFIASPLGLLACCFSVNSFDNLRCHPPASGVDRRFGGGGFNSAVQDDRDSSVDDITSLSGNKKDRLK